MRVRVIYLGKPAPWPVAGFDTDTDIRRMAPLLTGMAE